MKVLVTAAFGSVGFHITEMLLDQGYNLKALSYYNSFNFVDGWMIEGIQYTRSNMEIYVILNFNSNVGSVFLRLILKM